MIGKFKRAILYLLLFAAGVPAGAEDVVIWQEAEALSTTGGWSNDCQHVDLMGSPYLLATGVGYPVADASGKIEIRETGSHRLWVRCRDWYPEFSPGTFEVAVASQKSTVTFGESDDDAWRWIDGGSFDLEKGEAAITLTDLSGWWGRCDALVLAKGGFRPSNDPATLAEQRLEYAGVSQQVEEAGEYDVVVVGGGSAGLGAALASARNGARTAFIQDRPVLGGNGSSEIMVPPMGMIGGTVDRINVTGIAEELYPIQQWTSFADSVNIGEVVAREPNISLFLNTRATGVEMRDESTIAAVLAIDVRSGQRLRFKAPLFIDTTGHGWIGYYAGAEWRMGTEGKNEFNESLAPEEANAHTMGNSLYRADFRDMGKEDRFVTPEWAYQYTSADDFKASAPRSKEVIRPEGYDQATRGPGRPISAVGSKRGGAFTWLVELGGTENTIDDAEGIRDELFRLHVGLWGYSKNYAADGVKANRNLRMVWLNYVPGVRESRRLIGDYIMTQADFDADQNHPDLVAFTDWGIDDHQPHGYFTDGVDAIHVYGGKRVGMPYRSFYSKNISNLFMAGRCMSASHMALAGVRVQRPMTATGQAVGTAAAIASRIGTSPRGVYESHLVELQQTLLRDGCYIPGIKNEDPKDLALKASTRHATLIDGWNRGVRGISREVPWRGEPIELNFSQPQTVACVHLSLADRHHAAAFVVEGFTEGEWQELATTPGKSKQRRYVLNFDPVKTERLRFRLLRSSAAVSVAEIRAYAQPGSSTRHGLAERAPFPTDFDDAEVKKMPEVVTEDFPGIVVDDSAAEFTGSWTHSSFGTPVMGGSYQHDGDTRDGKASATFTATLPEAGKYEVRLAYTAFNNRASNVPVTITHAGGVSRVVVNQKKKPPIDGKFVSLGIFEFRTTGSVALGNEDTNGYVIADGVQWLPQAGAAEQAQAVQRQGEVPNGKEEDRPNILLIFADDIGYEALNCYGGLDFKTPHLDRMAKQGLRFSRAYTSPVCTPSRVSLHTSLYTTRHGHTGVLPVHLGTDKKVDFEKMPTFAQLMRTNGYATSVTGKWQLATLEVWPEHIRGAGFDSWCVWQIWREGEKTLRHWKPTFNQDGEVRGDIADRFGPDVLTDYVVDQMKAAKNAGQPFLIVHNELLPHYPMIDTPVDRELGRTAKLGHMIEYMDQQVGRLLDAVEELGIRDKTYVIFMGDNGTEESYFKNPKKGQPGERNNTRHTVAGRVNGGKNQLNDAGSHVPLIVWGPSEVPVAEVCDDLIDVVDLFPTFCDLSGTKIPEALAIDGRSIAPQFHGREGTPRAWTHQGLSRDQNLFDGSWRLARKSGDLIDARSLPAEPEATAGEAEADSARERLRAIFETLSKKSAR